jgi:hypothetical protein
MTNAENTTWPFPTAGDGKDPPKGLTSPGDEAPPGTPGTGEQVCSRCGGTGMTDGGARCEVCEGTGKVTVGIGGG